MSAGCFQLSSFQFFLSLIFCFGGTIDCKLVQLDTRLERMLRTEQETQLLLTGRAQRHITVFPIEYDSKNNGAHMTSDRCN